MKHETKIGTLAHIAVNMVLALVLAFGLLPGMPATALADEGNTSSSWTVNADGTLSISSDAAKRAIGEQNNISMILVGTLEGTIGGLPTSEDNVIVKKDNDTNPTAVMILYRNGAQPDAVESVLTNLSFTSTTTSVNIVVTHGDTTGSLLSGTENTLGVLNASGEAHVYKYVAFATGASQGWISAFVDSINGTDVLGGLKGYLATVTTSEEADLLNAFYTKVNPGNTNGAWIAGTSLRFAKTGSSATDYCSAGQVSITNYGTNPGSSMSTNHTITADNGTYYGYPTSAVQQSEDYYSYYYWACGPEAGETVPNNLWKEGEPNNSDSGNNGESCVVASWNNARTFNDLSAFRTNVPGYFLEFSAYTDGTASNGGYVSTTIYRVSYDGNGATGTVPAAQEKFKGSGLTLASNTDNLVRAGYVFAGWSTSSNASAAEYSAGATYEGNATTTLYAVWTLAPAVTPVISAGPQDLNLTYGYASGNVLKVTVEPLANHTLSYQWYSNTSASNEGGTKIDGATSESYVVPTGKDAGTTLYYYCVVTAKRTDNNLSASATSNVATVAIGRAPLHVTAEPKSRPYHAADPELTYTVEGFVNGDSSELLAGTLAREEGEAAGTYKILQGTLSVASDNYEIVFSGADFTIVPVGDGTAKTDTVAGDGAPEVTPGNIGEVADAVLTDEERQAMADGAAVRVWLEVAALAPADVPAADATTLESYASSLGATPGQWLDLSVWKSVTGFDATQVHDTDVPLRFTIAVPESLRKAGRTFWLLAVHDGQTRVVATGTGDALSGESSLFSTYLIAYKDPAPASATRTAVVPSRAIPAMGDVLAQAAGPFGLAALAGASALAASLGLRRRKTSKSRHMKA